VCVSGFIVCFLSFVFALLHCLLPSLRRIKIDIDLQMCIVHTYLLTTCGTMLAFRQLFNACYKASDIASYSSDAWQQ